MTNGFYETDSLSNKDIKSFVRKAIRLSYRTLCETKYKGTNKGREIDKELSIDSIISGYFKSNSKHGLKVIDRFTYNQGIIAKYLCEYEICLVYDWTFLYIFVNENNFNLLIKKYNLKLIEW